MIDFMMFLGFDHSHRYIDGQSISRLKIKKNNLLESTISAGMRIIISFMELGVMLGVVIHTFSYKTAFFARVMLLLFVMNLYMLLDNFILGRLERTPSADTFEIFFLDSWR